MHEFKPESLGLNVGFTIWKLCAFISLYLTSLFLYFIFPPCKWG